MIFLKAEDVITELYRLKCDEPLKGSQMQLVLQRIRVLSTV
jgi:hypothetical protein